MPASSSPGWVSPPCRYTAACSLTHIHHHLCICYMHPSTCRYIATCSPTHIHHQLCICCRHPSTCRYTAAAHSHTFIISCAYAVGTQAHAGILLLLTHTHSSSVVHMLFAPKHMWVCYCLLTDTHLHSQSVCLWVAFKCHLGVIS